jgi:hypothetical protein
VVSFSGGILITQSDTGKTVKPKMNMPLMTGDKVTTEGSAFLDMAFGEGMLNIARVDENSTVIVKLQDTDKIELIGGELWTVLKNLKKGETFRVKTPCAVAGARGTIWATKIVGKGVDVSVLDGKVSVQGASGGKASGKGILLGEGFKVYVDVSGRINDREKISPDDLARMRKIAMSMSGAGEAQRGSKVRKIENILNKGNKVIDERFQGIIEEKEESRIEQLRDNKSDDSGSGRTDDQHNVGV